MKYSVADFKVSRTTSRIVGGASQLIFDNHLWESQLKFGSHQILSDG